MNGFVTLAESKEKFTNGITKSASFIATVIKEGDLKAGTGTNGDWTRKVFTIQDPSATEEITAWNEETKLLKVGYRYEFNSPYWKDYKGTPQLNIGQYCQIKCIGSITTSEAEPKPEKEPQLGDTPIQKIPEPSEVFKDFIQSETMTLLQIEQVVKDTMRHYDPHQVDQKVGMFVKEIYRQSRQVNLKKASDMH